MKGIADMEIRRLYPEELSAGLKLIWETFLEFEAPDYSQEGINSFHDFITTPDCLVSLEFIGAFQEGQLKGVIAAKDDRRHICCFFVEADSQRQGIGRMLWNSVKKGNQNNTVTVNSSPYAVPFYHKLGFVDTDTEQITDGIRYTPMEYRII